MDLFLAGIKPSIDLGFETKNRLTKGRRLVEMLKQFCGSPINLRRQIGILSLANQSKIKELSIKGVQVFLNLYFSVPAWVLLFASLGLD